MRLFIILVGLLLLAIPATVRAQFGYITNTDNTITITSYGGPGGAVSIPNSISGRTVTAIGSNVFYTNSILTSVTIPNSIKSIGYESFFFCTSLSNITMSDNVTNFGYYSFGDCRNLPVITIPESVTSIGEGAFYTCIKLKSVTIPVGVSSIAEWTFGYCSSLTNVTISDSVTNIADYAFPGCSSLTSVKIPDSVTSIGDAAFGSSGLTNVSIPGSVMSLGDGSTGGDGAFYDCSYLRTVTIGNGVSMIEEGAFSGCSSLASVTIYGNVTSIGSYAFYLCSSLASIYFSGNAPGLGADSPLSDGSAGDRLTIYYLNGPTGWVSPFAGLTAIQWNPQIETGDGSFGLMNDQFGFNITGTNNFTVVVEACTNLSNPIWTPVQTNTLVNGSFYFSEPIQTNIPCRFYGLGLP